MVFPNDSPAWLARLVGFPTVSRDSNLALIEDVQAYLAAHAIEAELTYDDAGTKANLHAVIGPQDVPGVMLSGHSDVVPVDGQDWTGDPFRLREADGKLYGRGAADMKGFLACALAAVPEMAKADLKVPIHLALSYDEEIGCIGVRRLIDQMSAAAVKPAFCIVGEPTLMKPAIAHKGKTGMVCRCRGREAHSALAPTGLNAIYLANEMIAELRALQAEIIECGNTDAGYQVPYSTIHVGTIAGGTALNIVPNFCEFKFEARTIGSDDPAMLVDRIQAIARSIVERYEVDFPEANIEVEVFNAYPALDTDAQSDVLAFVKSLTGANDHFKVSFGTEGGLFQQKLGMATVVCGPGSMDQGHKPDEFIALSQLEECDRFMGKLIARLTDTAL